MDDATDGDQGGWAAVPAVYEGEEGRPGPVMATLDVDGETFALRAAAGGGTYYDWLTGPNEGYGFTTSGGTAQSPEQHREAIRGFLAQIDPATGYLSD